MVVGEVTQDGEGAVVLFDEDEAHHLVGEGHAGEGEAGVGGVIDGGREAVGSADDEDEAAGQRGHLLLQPLGKVGRGVLLAAFVEEDDVVAGLQLAQQLLPFALALLLVGEAGSGADVGDDAQFKGGEAGGACQIVIDGAGEVGVVGLADSEENGFHKIRN